MPWAIIVGLRLRQVDVLTAYEDQSHEATDSDLLDRATSLGRVLFTQDDDLLAEATHRQQSGVAFGGVIYAHQESVSIGQCVQDLEVIAIAGIEGYCRFPQPLLELLRIVRSAFSALRVPALRLCVDVRIQALLLRLLAHRLERSLAPRALLAATVYTSFSTALAATCSGSHTLLNGGA